MWNVFVSVRLLTSEGRGQSACAGQMGDMRHGSVTHTATLAGEVGSKGKPRPRQALAELRVRTHPQPPPTRKQKHPGEFTTNWNWCINEINNELSPSCPDIYINNYERLLMKHLLATLLSPHSTRKPSAGRI